MTTNRVFVKESIQIPRFLKPEDSIEILNLPTRLENILKNKQERIFHHFNRSKKAILTIKDLLELSDSELWKFRNIGVRSLAFLKEIKINIQEQLKWEHEKIKQDKTDNEVSPSSLTKKPINELMEELLVKCRNKRSTDVIKRRYGLTNGEKETLQEIGDFYGVTRERIRQIQALTLRRMKRLENDPRNYLIEIAEEILYEHDGIINDEEADKFLKLKCPALSAYGSSLFDLFGDLNWIQRYEIGDIVIYSPYFTVIPLNQLSEFIFKILKNSEGGMNTFGIADKINQLNKLWVENNRFNPLTFLWKYCRIDPRIEEIIKTNDNPLSSVFRIYSSGRAVISWIFLMSKVLENEQTPMHFTEISYKVNELIKESGKKIEVRRAHAVLIENKAFAHSGVKGTYGLTAWGFRKETTPELVEECIKKAGFPLHWKQIFEYVSKYKNTKPANIVSILEFNKRFKKIKNGIYGLVKNEPNQYEG